MTTTTTTGAAATTTAAAATTTKAATQTSADFNLFLKLLTTQAQNQDPLNPTDATQYTQQLAQFSQVEQTVQQTSVLKDILSRFGTQDLTQASNLIGRDATFDSATTGMTAATPARWTYDTNGMVGALTATIKDAAGKIVATQTIDASSSKGDFQWSGTTATGTQAPDGAYTLSLAGQDASGATMTSTIRSVGKVGEVQSAGGAVTLGVNGAQLPLSALVKLGATAG